MSERMQLGPKPTGQGGGGWQGGGGSQGGQNGAPSFQGGPSSAPGTDKAAEEEIPVISLDDEAEIKPEDIPF
jgi:hypothetical protein